MLLLELEIINGNSNGSILLIDNHATVIQAKRRSGLWFVFKNIC